MAKRLQEVTKPGPENGTLRCTVCGGTVAPRDEGRAGRYPKMLVCRCCHAEFGTTRPGIQNY